MALVHSMNSHAQNQKPQGENAFYGDSHQEDTNVRHLIKYLADRFIYVRISDFTNISLFDSYDVRFFADYLPIHFLYQLLLSFSKSYCQSLQLHKKMCFKVKLITFKKQTNTELLNTDVFKYIHSQRKLQPSKVL